MRREGTGARLETALLVTLVALSVALTGRIWISFPNPFLVKEPRLLVTTQKADLPKVMPIKSGGRLPGGGLFLATPGDPVAAAAFSALMKPVSSPSPEGPATAMQGVLPARVRHALEDPFWLFLLPAGLDPFLGRSHTGPSRLIADLRQDALFIVTQTGSFTRPLSPSQAHTLSALLAQRQLDAASLPGVDLGPGLAAEKARLTRLLGVPAALDAAGAPGLLLPGESVTLPGAALEETHNPSRQLVGSFFDNPLLVREIDEAGGIRSFTDGRAELRTFPPGRFVFSVPGARPGPAPSTGTLSIALAFLGSHPTFVRPSLPWSNVATQGGATVTFVPRVGNVPLINQPERVTINGAAVTGASGRDASVVLTGNAWALKDGAGLRAAFSVPSGRRVFAVFDAYRLVGSQVIAGQQVVFDDGTSRWLAAKGG